MADLRKYNEADLIGFCGLWEYVLSGPPFSHKGVVEFYKSNILPDWFIIDHADIIGENWAHFMKFHGLSDKVYEMFWEEVIVSLREDGNSEFFKETCTKKYFKIYFCIVCFMKTHFLDNDIIVRKIGIKFHDGMGCNELFQEKQLGISPSTKISRLNWSNKMTHKSYSFIFYEDPETGKERFILVVYKMISRSDERLFEWSVLMDKLYENNDNKFLEEIRKFIHDQKRINTSSEYIRIK